MWSLKMTSGDLAWLTWLSFPVWHLETTSVKRMRESYGNCWKLQWVADEACNMTENASSILIVIFSVQLYQTKTSERKLCIFRCGIALNEPPFNL